MPAASRTSGADGRPLPLYRTEDLFAGGRMAVVRHAGRDYELRITRANRLILTARLPAAGEAPHSFHTGQTQGDCP
jgi:hemin uptake protein HemP